MKNTSLVYIFILAGVLSSAVIISGCKKDTTKGGGGVTTDNTPKFKKEGELSFIRADSSSKKVDLEIASTAAEQEQGLMNRPWMEENQAMIFIFDKEEMQAFWMKNTIIPLDIIYINANKQIVHIAKNTQPFSEVNIPSVRPSQFVIEVIAGFCDKFNIKEGDTISWIATP